MTMKTTRFVTTLAMAALITSTAWAQGPITPEGSSAAAPDVVMALKAAYPKTQFDKISTTPIQGIYEVQMGKNIAYTDATGRYFVFGNLFDMKTQTDLTDSKRKELNKIEFSKLPLSDAIKTVKGKGERKLAVFADPNCGYCKRLEGEFEKLDNVTIYTFLIPILSPDSAVKARNVWCANDRAGAWKKLMVNGESITSPECDTPIERNLAVSRSYGVSGTPTLVAMDGRVLPGYGEAARIEAWLEGKQ